MPQRPLTWAPSTRGSEGHCTHPGHVLNAPGGVRASWPTPGSGPVEQTGGRGSRQRRRQRRRLSPLPSPSPSPSLSSSLSLSPSSLNCRVLRLGQLWPRRVDENVPTGWEVGERPTQPHSVAPRHHRRALSSCCVVRRRRWAVFVDRSRCDQCHTVVAREAKLLAKHEEHI